jgi:hypothetical protein
MGQGQGQGQKLGGRSVLQFTRLTVHSTTSLGSAILQTVQSSQTQVKSELATSAPYDLQLMMPPVGQRGFCLLKGPSVGLGMGDLAC